MAKQNSPRGRVFTLALTAALATAFVMAPALLPVPGNSDAAYAKGNGKDKGERGNGRDKSDRGNGRDKADRGNGNANKDKSSRAPKAMQAKTKSKGNGNGNGWKSAGSGVSKAIGGNGRKFKDSEVGQALNGLFKPAKPKRMEQKQTRTVRATAPKVSKAPKARAAQLPAEVTEVTLAPNQKGRWNAQPNYRAIEAHQRNGNYNGTVGHLALYDLALAANTEDYEDLSPLQKDALDRLGLTPEMVSFEDGELEGIADGAVPAAEFSVTDTDDGFVVECTNCADIGFDENQTAAAELLAQSAVDGYVDEAEMEVDEANAEQFETFFNDTEQKIIDASNKDPAGYEPDLLDDIAGFLGVDERPEFSDYPPVEDEALLILE